MSLIASAKKDGDYKLPPMGSHLARCYRVIDLGTQKTTWKGKEKAQPKVQIVFELHGEDNEGNPLVTDDGRPLAVSRRFTPSLSQKAALRAFLVSWRSRDFTEEEMMGFHLKNILNKWCMLTITHEPNNDGTRVYANISAATPVPKMIRDAGLPEGVNEAVFFEIDHPDMELFNSFPDYLKEVIEQSPEWQMRNQKPAAETAKKSAAIDDDDIPFN